ncbi:MAG: hypothetical protein JWP57_719 [Spirosoma sp.]|nr:hypothetical protein [Spirosoma sp.]
MATKINNLFEYELANSWLMLYYRSPFAFLVPRWLINWEFNRISKKMIRKYGRYERKRKQYTRLFSQTI